MFSHLGYLAAYVLCVLYNCQREYMQEHIEWEFMDFTDNIDTVNMIEKNIIGALNEQVLLS